MAGRIELPSGNAGFSGVSYYDLVLFVVPIPLLVGLLLGELLALPSQAGLMAGAALSALVVCHVLFFDPPTRRGPGGPTKPHESGGLRESSGLRESTGPQQSSEPRRPANGPSA